MDTLNTGSPDYEREMNKEHERIEREVKSSDNPKATESFNNFPMPKITLPDLNCSHCDGTGIISLNNVHGIVEETCPCLEREVKDEKRNER